MSEAEREAHEDEDIEQRARYRELLEELRTIIPGGEVLFAFLLTIPFSNRFTEVGQVGRVLFLVALVGSAVSLITFLTPASYHRLTPGSDREARIRLAVRTTVAGMAILGIAIVAGMLLVTRFVYGGSIGILVGVGLLLVTALLWYALPLVARVRRLGDGGPPQR